VPGLEDLAGIPICGSAGDQPAALFGQACFAPGQAKNTYGTGCFTLMNVGGEPVRSKAGLVTSVAWNLGGRVTYALEGSVFNAGSAIQWLRDELKLIDSAPECDRLAESVTDSGGVYLVPAFTGLGAPYWDMYARGDLLGITRGTTRAHIARAVLDSIAYQVTDLMNAMREDAARPMSTLRVDGGASVSDFCCSLRRICCGWTWIGPPRWRPPPSARRRWRDWRQACGGIRRSCPACGTASMSSPPSARRSGARRTIATGSGRWSARRAGLRKI
jgi:glycerol kinase